VIYAVLVGAVILALTSVAAILLLPKPGEQFTEFYMLGPEGLAENYPREVVAGQLVSLTVGVTNNEGELARYTVVAKLGEQQISSLPPFDLREGETWEGEMVFVLPTSGDDQQVDILLDREGAESPYRSLRLWMNVLEQ
jgi:uncharacterized membrane protein